MKNFYERYWDTEPAELSDYRYKWPVLSQYIPRDSSTILDYGCGKGKILSDVSLLNKRGRLYGADISRTARTVSKHAVPRAKILEIDENQKVSLPDHSCDFVLSLDVIEHIYDTDKVFSEFRRLVKKDGYLLLSTPYYGVIKNIIISLIGFNVVYHPRSPHIRFYTMKSLLGLLHDYGFHEQRIGYYGRFSPVWRGMYVLAKKL